MAVAVAAVVAVAAAAAAVAPVLLVILVVVALADLAGVAVLAVVLSAPARSRRRVALASQAQARAVEARSAPLAIEAAKPVVYRITDLDEIRERR